MQPSGSPPDSARPTTFAILRRGQHWFASYALRSFNFKLDWATRSLRAPSIDKRDFGLENLVKFELRTEFRSALRRNCCVDRHSNPLWSKITALGRDPVLACFWKRAFPRRTT